MTPIPSFRRSVPPPEIFLKIFCFDIVSVSSTLPFLNYGPDVKGVCEGALFFERRTPSVRTRREPSENRAVFYGDVER